MIADRVFQSLLSVVRGLVGPHQKKKDPILPPQHQCLQHDCNLFDASEEGGSAQDLRWPV